MVCDRESGFLANPNDPDDIAQPLGQLLENDEHRQSMGAKGKGIALDHFPSAKATVHTWEVYFSDIQVWQKTGLSNEARVE